MVFSESASPLSSAYANTVLLADLHSNNMAKWLAFNCQQFVWHQTRISWPHPRYQYKNVYTFNNYCKMSSLKSPPRPVSWVTDRRGPKRYKRSG